MSIAPARARPLVLTNCNRNCTFWPDTLGDRADAVHAIFEAGGTGRQLVAALTGIGIRTNTTSVWRHGRHLSPATPDDIGPASNEPPRTLDVLDAIVAAGYRNRRYWKPSIKDTIDALKFKNDLTGGTDSPFAALLAAMDQVDRDEPEATADEGCTNPFTDKEDVE